MEPAAEGWSGRKVLITGGAGYLADAVVRLLAGAACRIVRFDREGAVFPAHSGEATIEDARGDVRDRACWDALLDGVDTVFHLAAQTSVYVAEENPPDDLAVNVAPMAAMLACCARNGYRPAVLFSGTATECGLTERIPVDETRPDRPVTVYDLHKLLAERYLEYFSALGAVRGATLRLANVYGPGPRSGSADRGILNMMVGKALRGEPLAVYGTGAHLRDYIFVGDVAGAFLAARERIDAVNGRHFVIGSGRGTSIAAAVRMVAERASRRTGRDVPVLHVDPGTPQSPIEARDFVADSSLFSRLTGWRAGVTLEEGIDRTIDYLTTAKGVSA